jgi:hypothetical protein
VRHKKNSSGLDIHLDTLTGFVSQTPDFSLSIFDKNGRRGFARGFNLDPYDFVPANRAINGVFEGRPNDLLHKSLAGVQAIGFNDKFQDPSRFGRVSRRRLSDADKPKLSGHKKRVERASMLKSARLVVDSGLVLAVCLPTIEPPHTASAEFRQRSLPIQRKLRPLS